MAHWLLIHGAASSRLTWTQQIRVLPEHTRVDLPDLPLEPVTTLLDRWAAWCLEQLPGPSVVMGHSMGGAIAQLMALRAPEAVLGLVLVGTGPRFWVNPTLFELLASDPPQALAAMARWSLRPNPDPTLLAHNLAQIQTRDPHRVWCELKACALFDQRAALAALSLPVAIIAGAQDRMTPPALTREFLTIWPHASYDTIDRAGHLMMLENPDAFNRVLARLQSRYGW